MHSLPALRRRTAAAVTAGGSLAVILVLVAGMPYILWRSTGLPWPAQVPSLGELGERLRQPVGDPLLIDLLAMAGWACWAAFVATLLREACWYVAHLPQLLRDHRVHGEHVTALSVRRSLAALCIGTLVVALIGLWRPHPAGAAQLASHTGARPRIAATAPRTPTVAPQSSPGALPVVRTSVTGRKAAPGERSGAAARHIEYTVVAGDTLWDIADRHLGDALKWPRIYALNKDRTQHDGGRLSDPDLITAGWQLTIALPGPAAPSPVGPAREGTSPRPASPPSLPTPGQPAHDQADSAPRREGNDRAPVGAGQRDEGEVRQADGPPSASVIGLGEAGLIGITVAAGLLAARRYWYWHQDRMREPGQETETPALSPLVDKAMQAAHAATRSHPPQDPDFPVPRRSSPRKPQSEVAVTVGVRNGTEVLVDELAVPGGCTWAGPGAEAAARALLVGILTAAERQRPKPPQVQAVVPQDLAQLLLPTLPTPFSALTQSPDTAQAVQAAEQHLIAHARARDEHKSGEEADPGPESAKPGCGTLVLLVSPDAAHSGQVQALAARCRTGTLIVLTLHTQLPGADRWHITDDGTTSHPGEHHQDLTLFHLTPEAAQDISDVLLTAHGERPRPPAAEATGAPDPPDEPATPATGNVPLPRPEGDADRPAQVKPVRLHVLGPVTLYARGNPEPVGTNVRGEAREFLALLAAHPHGLLASDIADKLHLETDSNQNALKNLRRAVRRTLRAATGITSQEFILLRGELHRLHPELIETDLEDFTRSLKRNYSPGVDGSLDSSISAAQEALAHYRGPFAQGGDYLWADAIREHLAAQAIDTVLRLARKTEDTTARPGEREAVLQLLEQLGAIHPDRERLAQHTIRLYQAAGRDDAARHVYTRLKRHLAELGLEPEAASQVLVGAGMR